MINSRVYLHCTPMGNRYLWYLWFVYRSYQVPKVPSSDVVITTELTHLFRSVCAWDLLLPNNNPSSSVDPSSPLAATQRSWDTPGLGSVWTMDSGGSLNPREETHWISSPSSSHILEKKHYSKVHSVILSAWSMYILLLTLLSSNMNRWAVWEGARNSCILQKVPKLHVHAHRF